jgi:hypothetical protein
VSQLEDHRHSHQAVCESKMLSVQVEKQQVGMQESHPKEFEVINSLKLSAFQGFNALNVRCQGL